MQKLEKADTRFHVGDYIVYGNTGVCFVESVVTPDSADARHGFDQTRCYYVLKPLYQTEVIYTPTDNRHVFMRPVISKEEAERLIDRIPSVQAETYYGENLQDLRNHYRSATETYNCEDLIALTMSIYAKRQDAELQKRKFGEVDGKYMKQAEEMLHGEFAVVLGMERDEVPAYIARRVDAIHQTAAAESE